jgi:predicted metal-dependent peptidase
MTSCPFKQVELNPAHEKAWADTRVALLWHCPAFSHIFYTMLDNFPGNKHIAYFTNDVPIAATDGKTLFLNPDTFFKYNLNERVFACAHEICHCIMNHCVLNHGFAKTGKIRYPDGTELEFNAELMNIALDLVVNDLLIESKIGSFNKDWIHDQALGTCKESSIDVYRKLFKKAGGKDGKLPKIGVGFDQHLQPGTSEGKDPTQASAERNAADGKWKTEVAAGMNAARVQGKLPAAMDRALNEILDPKIDWREKIEALFARRVGNGNYNWRTLDRRLVVRDIIAPGRSGYGADTVIVGVDTSGSIGPKEVNMFLAEVGGILEDVRPKRVLVAWCDAKLHRVDEMSEPGDVAEARHKGAPGGGGTSFIPVFDYAAALGGQIDALVYLTDGMGSFPSARPSYPVIWGNISPAGSINYPFGDVVDIPVYK